MAPSMRRQSGSAAIRGRGDASYGREGRRSGSGAASSTRADSGRSSGSCAMSMVSPGTRCARITRTHCKAGTVKTILPSGGGAWRARITSSRTFVARERHESCARPPRRRAQRVALQTTRELARAAPRGAHVVCISLRGMNLLVRLLKRLYAYRGPLTWALHASLVALAYAGAYALRFDFAIPSDELRRLVTTLPYLVALRPLAFQSFGLFRDYWRHVGMRDLVNVTLAVTLSSAAFLPILWLAGHARGMSRAVLMLDWLLAIFFVGGFRFAIRISREASSFMKMGAPKGKRAFIIGAGEAGEQLLRQLSHDKRQQLRVVGLIDDDPDTHGRSLHGVRVLGGVRDLRRLVAHHHIELLVIAIPSADRAQLRRIVDRCAETRIQYKILPPLQDLLAKRAEIGQLRDVQLEDLLGREPVRLNLDQVEHDVAGTLRVAEAAARHRVKKFVLISTDKAVNPTSVLGATKRVAERVVLELPYLAASGTDFRAVRFGNVLGSDGSVLPLFKRQLAAGGPLTVTDPAVKRYFMTIPEAVQLVVQAAALPEAGGRIAMLEMGEQVRILDLAEQLIRLSGYVPHQDVQIEFTGLRPGEKLEEELLASDEAAHQTTVEKIRVIAPSVSDPTALRRGLSRLVSLMMLGDDEGVLRGIAALVPEYVPWQGSAAAEAVAIVPAPTGQVA